LTCRAGTPDPEITPRPAIGGRCPFEEKWVPRPRPDTLLRHRCGTPHER
jgi:hypothetical protein